MEITWHGQSFFEIRGKNGEGKINIAIDPFNENIGFIPPKKVEADILLISHSHSDHSNIKIIQGNPFLIDTPGEYDIKGVFIKGIPSFHDNAQGKERGLNTIFVLNFEGEGIKVCHLGDLGESQLSPGTLEDIVGADILFIPIGGNFTISGKEAAKMISQIEPKIVIPMHYKITQQGHPEAKPKDLSPIQALEDEKPFLQALGIGKKEKIKKLKIRKDQLKKEGAEIVLLEKC
jgi:L-ascorbate metabolism protein UlaG (beta-lactamase superfamily)